MLDAEVQAALEHDATKLAQLHDLGSSVGTVAFSGVRMQESVGFWTNSGILIEALSMPLD